MTAPVIDAARGPGRGLSLWRATGVAGIGIYDGIDKMMLVLNAKLVGSEESTQVYKL